MIIQFTQMASLHRFQLMYNLKYVLSTLSSHHPDEVIHASHLSQEDFQDILKSLMKPFHDKMKATPLHLWPGKLQRQPVMRIGLQVLWKALMLLTEKSCISLYEETVFLSDSAVFLSDSASAFQTG